MAGDLHEVGYLLKRIVARYPSLVGIEVDDYPMVITRDACADQSADRCHCPTIRHGGISCMNARIAAALSAWSGYWFREAPLLDLAILRIIAVGTQFALMALDHAMEWRT